MTTITGPLGVTIHAVFASHTVIYHEVADHEVAGIIAAIKAETHVSVQIVRDVKSLERA